MECTLREVKSWATQHKAKASLTEMMNHIEVHSPHQILVKHTPSESTTDTVPREILIALKNGDCSSECWSSKSSSKFHWLFAWAHTFWHSSLTHAATVSQPLCHYLIWFIIVSLTLPLFLNHCLSPSSITTDYLHSNCLTHSATSSHSLCYDLTISLPRSTGKQHESGRTHTQYRGL